MFPELVTVALRNTVVYTLAGFAFGLVLGLAVALMRLSTAAPYRWAAMVYIEIFRGLPALVIFILVGVGLPLAFPGLSFPGGTYGKVAFALGLVSAAYMAETIRPASRRCRRVRWRRHGRSACRTVGRCARS